MSFFGTLPEVSSEEKIELQKYYHSKTLFLTPLPKKSSAEKILQLHEEWGAKNVIFRRKSESPENQKLLALHLNEMPFVI